MNSPAKRLAHRHRPAAAGTDITLVGVRRGRFTRSTIAINDLIVGVARQAAADRAFGADDLLACACDQHAGVPYCARSAGTVKPNSRRAASLLVGATHPTSFDWPRAAHECRKRTGSARFSAPEVGAGGPWRVSHRGRSQNRRRSGSSNRGAADHRYASLFVGPRGLGIPRQKIIGTQNGKDHFLALLGQNR